MENALNSFQREGPDKATQARKVFVQGGMFVPLAFKMTNDKDTEKSVAVDVIGAPKGIADQELIDIEREFDVMSWGK